MARYEDEDMSEDVLLALENKQAEVDALYGEVQELLGQWIFAEAHGLKICDMTWLERNKITVVDAPDGEWELTKAGRRMQKCPTVRQAIDVLRAFDLAA